MRNCKPMFGPFSPHNKTPRIVMCQDWQRILAKAIGWRLQKQPAKGKFENNLKNKVYITGPLLKWLIMMVCTAIWILISPLSHPLPDHYLAPSPLPTSLQAGAPLLPLHQAVDASRWGLPCSHLPSTQLCTWAKYSHFPPVLGDKPPPLPTKTVTQSCHFSALNPPWPSIQSQSHSLYEGQPGLVCPVPCHLSSHPYLLILPPGIDQASHHVRVVPSTGYLIPPNPKGSLPCSLQICS